MTTHQILIAARKEIAFNNAFKKHPYIQKDNLIKPDIRKIILEKDIVCPTPTTPESFDGEKKSNLLADELLQWEVCPKPKYSLGQYIASKDGKGKIHKISRNHWGYVYCIWDQRPDGTIIGNACINESDIGNDNPITHRRLHPQEVVIHNPAHQ